MRNIMLTLEYDGGRYAGWQRLGKGESTNSIENKLLEVIKKMSNEDVELNAGCRTEFGVHAHKQVVNFKTNCTLMDYEIKNYINRYLPMDIAVTDVEEKPERFHASLNAKSKTYLYRIAIGDVPCVFDRKYTYYCFKQPDIAKMQAAAKLLIGKHDFRDMSTVKKTKTTVKEIYDIDIYKDLKEIQITIKANDFLHNMARMTVATLLDIGLNNRLEKEILEILDVNNNDVIGSQPIAPEGLFLEDIDY